MAPLKPVAILTTKYLRKMGLAQTIQSGSCCIPPCYYARKRPIYPAKVRMGFIPDDWFKFFYTKTGLTGPYVFGLGLLNYLFSKEIYVCNQEFYTGISMSILCIAAVKKLGPKLAQYLDDEIEKFEKNWNAQHAAEIKKLEDMINCELKEQWRAEGSLMLMQAKRGNIALQLEAAYREAIMEVYSEVKNRLDYQVACRFIENRIHRKHMISWVIQQVIAELPKNMDEKLIARYKANLSAMASKIK